MDNLQIITNHITPAKVDFNYKEISNQLDLVLDKYKGLIFTEETVSDCKKTMAELRKGQKALDDFRKNTKKELTESVTVFENDCKFLYSKFTDVIDPLKEQSDYFETNRKESKRLEVEGIIENLIEQYELPDKYSKELIVQDGYLIASISIKKVTDELEFQARELKDKQDEEELDKAFIIETVEGINENNKLDLLSESYTRLMDHMDTRTILSRINEDSKQLITKREDERLRLEKLELERLAKETELENKRIAKEEENKRIADIEDVEINRLIEEEITLEEEQLININDFDNLPKQATLINKTFNVSGNAEQMKDLETFLDAIFTNWKECK